MRLIDYYRADLAMVTSPKSQKAIRLMYFRALVETLIGRSLTNLPKPRGQRPNHKAGDPVVIVRFAPWWNRRSDDELDELYDALAPYFRHHALRNTRF